MQHQTSPFNRQDREHGSRDMKLQDVFLNHCRRERITIQIQLVDASTKTGQIIGFDSQTIILETDARQHLIYKTAIIAINPQSEVNYIFNESYRNELLKGYSEYAADFS